MKRFQITLFCFLLLMHSEAFCQPLEKNLTPTYPQIQYRAAAQPDRIILSWTSDPSSSQTVTWRIDVSASNQYAEIVKVESNIDFYKNPQKIKPSSKPFINIEGDKALFHTLTFKNLEPNTQYAYRVGNEKYRSEWFEFRTAEMRYEKPFRFIYMGDAQNDVYSLWSRVIRNAYKLASDARFILHVGDLINHAENDYEWAEWFSAGSHIFPTLPNLAVPGNHEYIKDSLEKKTGITPFWDLHFNFSNNSPSGFENRTYFTDYINCRIICLDSNEAIEDQSEWLEKVLSDHQKEWVIVMFHHPVISGARGRMNEGVLKNWKPLLDKYKVDLVLQGHDHVYGRGNNVNSELGEWLEDTGTVYVVSVAGRKMYSLSNHEWMQKKAQDLQTFQIITIEKGILNFKAYTHNNELFDDFDLIKVTGDKNKLIEKK